MSTGEVIPDSFNSDLLIPPTRETRQRFNEAIKTLNNQSYHELYSFCGISGIGQDQQISVSVQYDRNSLAGEEIEEKGHIEISNLGDKVFFEVVNECDDSSKRWLTDCYMKSIDKNLPTAAEINELLQASPFDVTTASEFSLFRDPTDKGASISYTNNQESSGFLKEEYSRLNMPVIKLNLTHNGTAFRYTWYADGREELYIRRPGKTVTSHLLIDDGEIQGGTDEVSIAVGADPSDHMHAITQEVALRKEAEAAGATKVSEASLQECIAALEAVLLDLK